MKHRVYYLVSKALKEVFREDAPGIALAISNHKISSPKAEFGDYASNVALVVAKMYPQLAPEGAAALAQKLANVMQALDNGEEFGKIEGQAGFINFSLSNKYLVSKPRHILSLGTSYGHSNLGQDKTVLLEYLSPNTNKPLHLGHIRNGVLGMSVAKLLETQRYKVVKTNIVNDRGIHICKSMLAWQKWGNGETPEELGVKGDHFVGDWYVRFALEEKNNPALLEEAQEMLVKWEKGDEETVKLWKKMRQWVLEGFAETYRNFDFSFDQEYFESEVYKEGKTIVEDALQKAILRKNEDGNVIFDLSKKDFGEDENGESRMLTVLRQDGTSLYITQDLGLAVKRQKEHQADEFVYVVGSEQNFHFQTLFALLKRLGFAWAEKLFHLSYGMVYLPEGKMKSREGTVVDADDLLSQMEKLAEQEILSRAEEKKLSSDELKRRSRQIALAAIKFYFLRNRPTTDIHFDPKESIALEGFTGPYLQYTHARIHGILRKHGAWNMEHENLQLTTYNLQPTELAVLRKLHQYPEILEAAAESRLPSNLAKYLFEMAQSFNALYQSVPVISEKDEELRNFRLQLVTATAQILKNGLETLGIEAPEEM